jgi:hypothetical protein
MVDDWTIGGALALRAVELAIASAAWRSSDVDDHEPLHGRQSDRRP